jgi:hypothetical protein
MDLPIPVLPSAGSNAGNSSPASAAPVNASSAQAQPMGSPSAQGTGRRASPTSAAVRNRWREKLTQYFTLVAPFKLKDVDAVLDYYDGKPGGFEAMWENAQKRFGPNPDPAAAAALEERAKWRAKLKAYYVLVDPEKTDADVEDCLNHFSKKGPDGFDKMWRQAQLRYGVIVDSNLGPATNIENVRLGGGTGAPPNSMSVSSSKPTPSQKPNFSNEMSAIMARPSFQSRIVIIVCVGGVSPKLYRTATPAQQYKFNAAVAYEVQLGLHLPQPLSVCHVSEGVDAVTVEMETQLPPNSGFTAESVGNDLMLKVKNGELAVPNTRRAYAEHLQGNPQRVFIVEAAVVEYRSSPGLRYHLKLMEPGSSGDGPSSSSRTNPLLLASAGERPPSPLRGGRSDLSAISFEPDAVTPSHFSTVGRYVVQGTPASKTPPLKHPFGQTPVSANRYADSAAKMLWAKGSRTEDSATTKAALAFQRRQANHIGLA